MDNTSDSNQEAGAGRDNGAEHRFFFNLNRHDDARKWSVAESLVTISGCDQRQRKIDFARFGGFMAIVASLMLLRLRHERGEEPILDGRASRSDRDLAKKVYQSLQDANKAKGKHYLNEIFGTTTIDGWKHPSIVKVLRAIGRTRVRFQDAVNPLSVQVEFSVNGLPITEEQKRQFLKETFRISIKPRIASSRSTASDIDGGSRSVNWAPSIAGMWNCTSTLLTPLGHLPRKIAWTLQLEMNADNRLLGTCWYQSPVPGGDHREIRGRVEGQFNPERGYLRLEWAVHDSQALGFGYFVLHLHSNGRSMDGYGIGHSSEGDGMFAVRSQCMKASVGKRRNSHEKYVSHE